MSRPATYLGLFGDALARWRTSREIARTKRIVSGLPPRMRMDIGWPDEDPPSRLRQGLWGL